MSSFYNIILITIIYWVHAASSVNLLKIPSDVMGDSSDSDLVQYINNKEYLPSENDMPTSILKHVDNDAIYILSKLSDEELLKLLNQSPKKNEYDLNDIVKISSNIKKNNDLDIGTATVSDKRQTAQPHKAFFRLDDKEVEPFNFNGDADPKYNAFQKLNNILYSRPQHSSEETDENKQMLFDILVGQLKTLCCKKTKPKIHKNLLKLKPLLQNLMLQKTNKKHTFDTNSMVQKVDKSKEQIFLIINDEIKSNVSEDLIAVDPESLSKNSSVLLLGPIEIPLSDAQLKLVMNRIANELSKPEYLPLLQKISEGALGDSNIGLVNSLIAAPDSRRYIKPHRCNHQSKLARVYGGPKWLICTGYLNLNIPSLYD